MDIHGQGNIQNSELTLLFWYAVTAMNMVSGKQKDWVVPVLTQMSFR
jgi:hypothetical protein